MARLPALSRIAYLLTGNHHDAQDLVQSVLVRLARHWRRVADAEAPESYLRRVIYHEHVSSWRRRRRVDDRSAPVDEEPSPDFAEGAVRRLVLQQALARLTPRQRAVLVLRFFEDMSEAETAGVLGCSLGTVKSQTHHALGRLRILAPELADFRTSARETTL